MWVFLYFSHKETVTYNSASFTQGQAKTAIPMFLIPQEQALLLLINSLDLHNNPVD